MRDSIEYEPETDDYRLYINEKYVMSLTDGIEIRYQEEDVIYRIVGDGKWVVKSK